MLCMSPVHNYDNTSILPLKTKYGKQCLFAMFAHSKQNVSLHRSKGPSQLMRQTDESETENTWNYYTRKKQQHFLWIYFSRVECLKGWVSIN